MSEPWHKLRNRERPFYIKNGRPPKRAPSKTNPPAIKTSTLDRRMTKSELRRWKTEELETAILSSSLDNVQRYEAERILRERELAPDRKLARRIYNTAA